MRTTADCVIIGGGIIGMTVAYHLAKADFGTVVLLERDRFFGAGSTAKAAGGIRAQFSNKTNVEISMLAQQLFRSFPDDTGWDDGYDACGYLFVVSNERDRDTFQQHFELQRSLGLPVEQLTQDEIAKLAPSVKRDDILFGNFCPADGVADPSHYLSGYEHVARERGVDLEPGTEVTGLTVTNGQITGVQTDRGTISTSVVVNCAGAWAKEIGRMAGAEVPVLPYRRQCVTTGELDWLEPTFPMVVDVASGLYTHRESKGLLLGWADPSVEASFDISVHPDYTDEILMRGLDRIPRLEEATVNRSWAGLYETTPDHKAILGWDPQIKGFLHNTGYSGHGFMHAPATGQLTMELITEQNLTIDISDLALDRFTAGKLVEETNVI